MCLGASRRTIEIIFFIFSGLETQSKYFEVSPGLVIVILDAGIGYN